MSHQAWGAVGAGARKLAKSWGLLQGRERRDAVSGGGWRRSKVNPRPQTIYTKNLDLTPSVRVPPPPLLSWEAHKIK